jgi:hypothetical protein
VNIDYDGCERKVKKAPEGIKGVKHIIGTSGFIFCCQMYFFKY